MGYTVDPGELDGLANSLRSGRDSIEDVASTSPEVPQAGDVSGEMGKLMSLFMGAAGEMSTGVAAAADAVSEGGRVYVQTDDTAEQGMPRMDG